MAMLCHGQKIYKLGLKIVGNNLKKNIRLKSAQNHLHSNSNLHKQGTPFTKKSQKWHYFLWQYLHQKQDHILVNVVFKSEKIYLLL